MPGQFIKVKNCDIQSTNNVFTENVKRQESGNFGSSSNISNSNSDICRICHCEADHGNPLLTPCYCSGSLKYVHQSCLQQWLAASDSRSCELCKFNFILHTKIKPIGEWRRLEMSSVERRRLLCAILFHFVAAICVVWSLFVLIDRATEEVQKGLIAWPLWTKLVVVAVGFTGGAVFMYIQCRQYLQLFSRWKAHNRIILVQNAPEKVIAPPSPTFTITLNPPAILEGRSSQVVANVECNAPRYAETSNPLESCYVFENGVHPRTESDNTSVGSSCHKTDISRSDELCIPDFNRTEEKETTSIETGSFDALELNIREILALDVEYASGKTKANSNLGLASRPSDVSRSKTMFKSLPNLCASSENLIK